MVFCVACIDGWRGYDDFNWAWTDAYLGRDLADINQVMLVMIVIVVVGIVIDKCIFSVIERHVLGKRGLQK